MNHLSKRLLDRIFDSSVFQFAVFSGLAYLVYVFWLRPEGSASIAPDENTAAPATGDEMLPRVDWEAMREFMARADPDEMLRWSMQVFRISSN